MALFVNFEPLFDYLQLVDYDHHPLWLISDYRN